jgi:DNA invertase Pin-like site-specific DNA recombinase
VARQEKDCRDLAHRRGWRIAEIYAENDTSAFKRRKVRLPDGTTALRVDRPAFRKLIADLAAGTVTALVAYDLDRVARDPRDLEDLIDVVESHKIPTAAVTGSLDLSTDAGVTMARIAVAIANKSSRDTSRRVARKHLELAELGKVGGGGIRSYGYARDGMTIVDSEAAIIRELAERIIGGETLSALARDLTERRVPTVQAGTRWNARSVHSVVSKARVAGLREHRGEVMGAAAWPPIIDVDTWTLVKASLAERAQGSNNRLIRWLTGVLFCGRCGHRLTGALGPAGRPSVYRCAKSTGGCGRLNIAAPATEEVIGRLIVAYLGRPDVLADLAAETSHENAKQARKDAAADEAQMVELAALWGKRQMSTKEYLAARKEIEGRLSRSKAIMRASTPPGVRALLASVDITTAWDKMTNPHDRREVARMVFPHGIKVMPITRRTFGYDPNRLVPIEASES